MKPVISGLVSSRGGQFVLLSGFGWCLDFAIFYANIAWLGLQPAWANMISATVAAMTVFVIARWVIFDSGSRSFRSTIIYLAYTEFNIVVWALVISFVASLLHSWTSLATATGAVIAKIIVTPISLFLNFVVSRRLSRDGSNE
ncbi:GtrA family protein [Xanthomonas sacchari]